MYVSTKKKSKQKTNKQKQNKNKNKKTKIVFNRAENLYKTYCGGAYGVDCDSSYTGETEREHCQPGKRKTSEVVRHFHTDCPDYNIRGIQVLDQDPRWFERGAREEAHIRINCPDLNRNGGRHNLPHI